MSQCPPYDLFTYSTWLAPPLPRPRTTHKQPSSPALPSPHQGLHLLSIPGSTGQPPFARHKGEAGRLIPIKSLYIKRNSNTRPGGESWRSLCVGSDFPSTFRRVIRAFCVGYSPDQALIRGLCSSLLVKAVKPVFRGLRPQGVFCICVSAHACVPYAKEPQATRPPHFCGSLTWPVPLNRAYGQALLSLLHHERR